LLSHLRRFTSALDRLQRRHKLTGILFGVTKRYGDDRGGQLAALTTFYGFLSVFPLLLLLLTVVGIFLNGSSLQKDIIDSALGQFPIIGNELGANIHAVAHGNPGAVIASVLGLTWGSLGVTSSLQNATHRLWRLPQEAAPGLWPRTWKGLQLLTALLLIVVLSSIAAGMSTVGAQFFGGNSVVTRGVVLASALVVNLVGYFAVLWLLSPKSTTVRTLVPGVILGAVGWTTIQAFSGYLIGHQLHHASQIYGFFAVVLGLIFWINLGAQLFLYSTELNIVLVRHEWPRYVFGEPVASG
jgi:YihY family inner membrane protein